MHFCNDITTLSLVKEQKNTHFTFRCKLKIRKFPLQQITFMKINFKNIGNLINSIEDRVSFFAVQTWFSSMLVCIEMYGSAEPPSV